MVAERSTVIALPPRRFRTRGQRLPFYCRPNRTLPNLPPRDSVVLSVPLNLKAGSDSLNLVQKVSVGSHGRKWNSRSAAFAS